MNAPKCEAANYIDFLVAAQRVFSCTEAARVQPSSLWPVKKPWPPSKKPRALGGRRRLIRVRLAEVRRFSVALLWGTARGLIVQVRRWSNWRRHHQAAALCFHYKARNALACLQL